MMVLMLFILKVFRWVEVKVLRIGHPEWEKSQAETDSY